jgi:hypothetical protein
MPWGRRRRRSTYQYSSSYYSPPVPKVYDGTENAEDVMSCAVKVCPCCGYVFKWEKVQEAVKLKKPPEPEANENKDLGSSEP